MTTFGSPSLQKSRAYWRRWIGSRLSQIAINWSTQKDYIDTAICGVSKLRHVEENCSATNWTLTPEELALLDRAIETLEENEI